MPNKKSIKPLGALGSSNSGSPVSGFAQSGPPPPPIAAPVTLIGAGLVGSLLSLYLSREGHAVEIFEGRPDMRLSTISAGRSINLALSTRGIYALHELGLEKEVLALTIPMLGRMVHAVGGQLDFLRYGHDDSEYINSVSRGDLNKLLMTYSEKTGRVKINFEKRVSAVDLKEKSLSFSGAVARAPHKFNILIGTDGSASPLRHALAREKSCDVAEEYLDYGYKELTLPAGRDGAFLLEKTALHIWPRGTYMLIALPNLDGSFTATLFLPNEGELSFAKLQSPAQVHALFAAKFADVLQIYPGLIDDFFAHPVGQMVTVKAQPWSKDATLLLGDAAHAIVPFFGQGMNCGFEDCTILNSALKKNGGDFKRSFAEFSESRKADADAIADLAVENFIEMRDHVSQKQFVFEKSVERILQKKFPDDYISRYQLVTFTRVPYAVAAQAGAIQSQILTELSAGLKNPEEVDLLSAEALIKQRLTKFLAPYRGSAMTTSER